MKQDFIAIQEKLFEELALHETRTPNLLERTRRGAQMVRKVLAQLKTHVLENDFSDKAEELAFYKNIFPHIHSQNVYYSRLFRIEADSPRKVPAEYKRFLEQENERINLFFEEHGALFIYHRSKASDMDEVYFLRNSIYNNNYPDDLDGMLDTRFCNPNSIRLGELIGLERVKEYLEKALEEAEVALEESKKVIRTPLLWTARKADLAELGYAIYASKALNHGRAELKQIFGWLEASFNISLGNPYSIFRDLRVRKGERARFAEVMKTALEKLMEEMDEDTSRVVNGGKAPRHS